MRVRKDSRVIINPNSEWGIRVLDPWTNAETQSFGASDAREYDPAVDGPNHLVRAKGPGKASYLTVRGVHYAPSKLMQGVTESGRICWFRSSDIIAVEE
jgi:hypothetical protein